MNPMQMLQSFITRGLSPQKIVEQMMDDNPMIANLMKMANSGNTSGVENFALFNNGEQIPGTLMVETISTAGDYANIGINKEIRVCCKGNANISVRAVPSVPTATAPATPITTQIPIIGNANLVIDRRC